MSNNIIGISGKLGSGKTTQEKLLSENYGYVPTSFAEKVREVLSIITGIPIDETRSTDQKSRYILEFDKTIGQMLQDIGNGLRESLHKDIWIISSMINSEGDRLVYGDVRYRNEADMIKEKGGVLIRLEGDPMSIRARSTRNLNHVSETDLDNYKHFDIVIDTDNNNIEEVHEIIKEIVGLNNES